MNKKTGEMRADYKEY